MFDEERTGQGESEKIQNAEEKKKRTRDPSPGRGSRPEAGEEIGGERRKFWQGRNLGRTS